MFRSIRWRLVASYALLTLLTVSLVGVLGLSLLQDSIQQQEQAILRTNAEAIARQAERLVQPVVRTEELQNLVQAASLLGDDQVSILDEKRRLVANSDADAAGNSLVWLLPPGGLSQSKEWLAPGVFWLPDLGPLMGRLAGHENLFSEQLPPEMGMTIVRRLEQPWGTKLVFESVTVRGSVFATPSVQNPRSNDDEQRARITAAWGEQNTDGEQQSGGQSVTMPIGNAAAPLGFVHISRSASLADEALVAARRALAWSGLLAAGLSIVLGLVVGRSLTRPLVSLTAAADRMSEGDLTARAAVAGSSELAQLSEQFNSMATQLQSSFTDLAAERDALRAFIADASHELRTPITALRNFNDLLLGTAQNDPEARVEFLAESRTQLERLEWITQHLLDLSRIDAGLIPLDWETCAVQDMIEAAAAGFKHPAQERGIALSVLPIAPDLSLRCDRNRVELALANLLDNAVSFTPTGGQITIGATEQIGVIELWVQDTGPGVMAEDRPHIFERFYHGRVGGTGLGLAIVRSVAQAHGGHAYLDEAYEQGSRFVIALPQPK